MKEQITEFRIEIDALSQLVNNLISFEVEHFTISKKEGLTKTPVSDIRHVVDEDSFNLNNSHEHAFICRTDRGTFRFSSTNKHMTKFITLDQKSKEINKCYDSLILAKAWLGKILQLLGTETPYKNDGNRKTVEDIEKTADIYFQKWNDIDCGVNMSHIEKVDWLREKIKKIINNLPDYWKSYSTPIRKRINEKLQKEMKDQGVKEPNKISYDKYKKEMGKISDWQMEILYVKKDLSEARFWLGFELGRIRENQ